MTKSELLNKIENLKKKASAYDKTQNEGGEGYNPYRDELESLDISILSDTPKMEEKAEWTEDDAIERREEWNGFVKANMKNGRFDHSKVAGFEQKAGWGMTELKNAVKKYNL